MKKGLLFCVLLIFGSTLFCNAQSIESLTQQNEQFGAKIKVLTEEIKSIKSKLSTNKTAVLKEPDAVKRQALLNEVKTMEEQVKAKTAEINSFKKETATIKQQINTLKQNAGVNKTLINKDIITGTGVTAGILNNAANWVEIFELPNYQGRSKKFEGQKIFANISLLFSSQNISFKFKNEEKAILYIAKNSDKNNTQVFVSNQGSAGIQSDNIYTLYLGIKEKVAVTFNGILSNIHNNDCKKVYGNISYSLVENNQFNGYMCINKAVRADGINSSNVTVFDQPTKTDYVCPFIYQFQNLNPNSFSMGFPLLKGKIQRDNFNGEAWLQTTAQAKNAVVEYYVDSVLFYNTRKRAGYVTMEIATKIGSAHKGCDVCTDFTWDATMNETVNESIASNTYEAFKIINRSVRPVWIVQAGKYRTDGMRGNSARDKAVNNYTKPAHETYIQFSVRKPL